MTCTLVSRSATIACLSVLVPALSIAAPSLSDRELRTIIEADFGHPSQIPIGSWDVLGGLKPDVKSDLDKHEITESDLKKLATFEKHGLVRIRTESLRGKADFSFKDLNEVAGRGLVGRTYIDPTPRALQLGRVGSNKNVLEIPDPAVLDNVVRNEEQKKGVDDLRVIMGTVKYSRPPEMQAVRADLYGTAKVSDREKFILLLKHDPFTGKWRTVAVDSVPEDLEFRTDNVSRQLAH